jgi:ribosomal protein L16/L10AE
VARAAFNLAAYKLPIKTKFIVKTDILKKDDTVEIEP